MGRAPTANQSPRDPHEQPGVLKGSHPQTPLPGDRDNGKWGFPLHSEPSVGLGRQDAPHSSSEREPQEKLVFVGCSSHRLQDVAISIHLHREVANERCSFSACPILGAKFPSDPRVTDLY